MFHDLDHRVRASRARAARVRQFLHDGLARSHFPGGGHQRYAGPGNPWPDAAPVGLRYDS